MWGPKEIVAFQALRRTRVQLVLWGAKALRARHPIRARRAQPVLPVIQAPLAPQAQLA
jgi:hypothetical protein